eukprot:scaffold181434_cov31-Tisochrysis_lutea.AAC.7
MATRRMESTGRERREEVGGLRNGSSEGEARNRLLECCALCCSELPWLATFRYRYNIYVSPCQNYAQRKLIAVHNVRTTNYRHAHLKSVNTSAPTPKRIHDEAHDHACNL